MCKAGQKGYRQTCAFAYLTYALKNHSIQNIGIPTIGTQMNDDKTLHSLTLELRMLMGVMAKMARMSLEQRLQAQGNDMSGLQYHLLRVLAFDGEQTTSELAKKLHLDPSTLVPAVDGLERREMVTRERDSKDRRRVIIRLAPRGEEVVKAFDVIGDDDPMLLSLRAMGEADARQLVALLKAMIQHLPEGDAMLSSVQARLNGGGEDRC
jgi:DNA-binding MarR family transcriptional regulator